MAGKRFAKISAAIGVAAVLTGTAFVGSAGAYAAPGKQSDVNDPRSRRVCRTVTPSGSRLSSRICRTQAEWEESRSKTQQGMLERQTNEASQLEQCFMFAPVGSERPR